MSVRVDAGKEEIVEERGNRERTEEAFRDWQEGTGYFTDLLADALRWTITGAIQGRSEVEGRISTPPPVPCRATPRGGNSSLARSGVVSSSTSTAQRSWGISESVPSSSTGVS